MTAQILLGLYMLCSTQILLTSGLQILSGLAGGHCIRGLFTAYSQVCQGTLHLWFVYCI